MATSPTLYPFTNDQGDTFDTLGPDEVPTGDTIELDGHRYTVDHVEGGDDGADHLDVHTTSGAVLSVPADDSLTVVTRRGIPAPATEPDRRVAGTVVHHWSGVTLPAAATLVRRADLRTGDVVQSSHGYRLHITSATVQGATSALRGTLHGPTGDERTERYDADTLIPVYVRGPEPTPAPAETITITLTREQAQHLDALVDHADRWHSEWGEYIRPDAVLNKDITEQEAEETATEHEEAAALGIELLRQAHAATTEPPTTPTE
ncbi:hypothetical protein ACFCZ3_20210 [Cellulosimicrobium cellulans]|uniref:hypothetical protein n=1 Tax=Cellulosimicrobium cellulans TaxID=1710 RepID=UPI0035D88B04